MPTEPQDIVVEARELLNAPNSYTLRGEVRELLRQLADEVERLRNELDDAYFDRNECGGRP